MGDKDRLIIGRLTKPHGLKGELKMHYFGSDPDSLKHLKDAFVVKSDSSEMILEIKGVRASKNVFILKFDGIDSIDDALSIVGACVHINKSELEELAEGEYYWDDLIGVIVYDENGELIGELTDIFHTRANDVYVVKHGGKELLIPAVSDVIMKVDINNKTMHVHLLEGMRDDI